MSIRKDQSRKLCQQDTGALHNSTASMENTKSGTIQEMEVSQTSNTAYTRQGGLGLFYNQNLILSCRSKGQVPEEYMHKSISNLDEKFQWLNLEGYLDSVDRIVTLGTELLNRLQIIAEKKTLEYEDLLNMELLGVQVKDLELTSPDASVYLMTESVQILCKLFPKAISVPSSCTIADFLSTWVLTHKSEPGIPKCSFFTVKPARERAIGRREWTRQKTSTSNSNRSGGVDTSNNLL